MNPLETILVPRKEASMKADPHPNVEQLRCAIGGRVVTPGDGDYEQLRQVWNGMIDRRPALIVQCASSADVAPAIAFARRHALPISIRGAGHNIAGNALADGGLVIDFSRMKAVRVDAARSRAFVEPGATLGDLDEATQRYGLATPVGVNSTTGVAGLTLGGGFGWLTRKYGLTIDNLRAVQLVDANGERLRASETERPELFWALRGGGGNFGVVTEFEFGLHKVGPEITSGLIAFPLEQADRVLRGYRELVRAAPDDLSVWAVLRHAPPLPFLHAGVHGRRALILALFHPGATADAEPAIGALRKLGEPWGEHFGRQPYLEWQRAFDPLLAPGARNYWKSHNFTELPDAALEVLVQSAQRLPGPECEIFLAQVGGAANRIAPDATAYGHRDARFVMNIHGRWTNAADDAKGIAWAREVFGAMAPFASSGAYVNFMTHDETDRIESAYGANYARLVDVKERYDPHNVFRMNQNIRPNTMVER
jgi:FAD/FMN-containing dehydrogenase